MQELVDQSTGLISHTGTAAAASDAAKSVAEIQAAMTIAKKFPRNQVQCIDKIKISFQRSGLAEVSQYQYAKGGASVAGPSIRSAEAIAQQWGNMEFGFRELSRGTDENGHRYSEIEAYAWDMESNTKRPATFIVKHWRDTRQGSYAITDEREIYELTANMAQRRVRACIMAVIPGDVFDVAMEQAAQTLNANCDISPEAVEKMLATYLDEFKVTKEDIEARIQCHVDAIQPAQMVGLKRIYVSLKDGMSIPSQWFKPVGEGEQAAPKSEDDVFETNFEGWAEKIKSGKKTAKEMIAFIGKTVKLTAAQKKRLNAVKKEVSE